MGHLHFEKLGRVTSFLNGGTPSTANEDFFSGVVSWITGADISDFRVTKPRHLISEEAIEKSSTSLVPKGTVLLVTRTSVGKVAVSPTPLCFSQDITAVLPKNGKADATYLMYFLATQEEHFKRLQRGATINGITRDVIEDVDFPLPTNIDEQKRIAGILDKADRLRRQRRYAETLSDSFLQSVFIKMFGDPVANPKGWEKVGLSTFGKLDRGKSKHRPRNAPHLYGGPYPFVQTGDIANATGYVTSCSQFYSEEGLKQSKLWPKGTLCITIAANIAKTAILTFDACFPDSVVGFTANKQTNSDFVQAWFSFVQRNLEETAPESAQKNINLEILREIQIIKPSLPLQETFAKIVQKFERIRRQQREATRQAEHLFQTLLHRAFTDNL